jgi:hypothetical protein
MSDDNIFYLNNYGQRPSTMKQLFIGTIWIIDECEQDLMTAAQALYWASSALAQTRVAHAKRELTTMHETAGRFRAEIEFAKRKIGDAFAMASTLHAEIIKYMDGISP